MKALVLLLALVALAFPDAIATAIINGTAAGETLFGTRDRDWINGRGGSDVLIGRTGSDTLIGLGGNDREYGNGGEDWHFGGNGNDLLYATARDGVVDHLDGGGGIDTCVYRGVVTLVSCERRVQLSP